MQLLFADATVVCRLWGAAVSLCFVACSIWWRVSFSFGRAGDGVEWAVLAAVRRALFRVFLLLAQQEGGYCLLGCFNGLMEGTCSWVLSCSSLLLAFSIVS